MLEGYTVARLPRRPDRAHDARPARHRRHLPPPGPAGQDRDDARRALRRPRDARHRRGLVRARAPRRSACRTRRWRERFERLEETLQICLQMWSDDDGPYEGKHYQLAETICSPRADPAAAPADPDRRQRREEDAAAGGPVRRRLQPVRDRHRTRSRTSSTCCARHCDDRGPRLRRPIEKTIIGGGDPIGDPDGFVASMEEYAQLGIDLVELAPRGPDPLALVTELGEQIVPRLAQLG